FLQVSFTLTGQLIHSIPELNRHTPFRKTKGGSLAINSMTSESEVRPVAFKSILRYWFRAIGLGVLPVTEVRDRLEPQLFGAIQPQQTQGWLKCQVQEISAPKPRTLAQEQDAECLFQSGILNLSISTIVPLEHQKSMEELFNNLTWLMFHLGGVGQGARRPQYSRKNRSNPPWYRGTNLRIERVVPEEDQWQLPSTLQEFKQIFHLQLRGFYQNLAKLTQTRFSPQSPLPISGQFIEVIGKDCTIVVCRLNTATSNKPFALDVLHRLAHQGNGKYDPQLCGDANRNPSPIWIANFPNYQVVTVFQSSQAKRKNFLANLRQEATECETLWDGQGIRISSIKPL
ncbi:MAG: type III-B CRISPR module RAMP protein Cmr6, partial [Planktothrix sp.]